MQAKNELIRKAIADIVDIHGRLLTPEHNNTYKQRDRLREVVDTLTEALTADAPVPVLRTPTPEVHTELLHEIHDQTPAIVAPPIQDTAAAMEKAAKANRMEADPKQHAEPQEI